MPDAPGWPPAGEMPDIEEWTPPTVVAWRPEDVMRVILVSGFMGVVFLLIVGSFVLILIGADWKGWLSALVPLATYGLGVITPWLFEKGRGQVTARRRPPAQIAAAPRGPDRGG